MNDPEMLRRLVDLGYALGTDPGNWTLGVPTIYERVE